MRILVWGINYAPEVTGIGPCNTALCQHLRAAGHDVEMVTTFPYYPAWRKRPEDCGRLWRTDVIDGVPVHRCWHYVPREVRWWKRILHEATFIFTSLPRALSCRRPDVIVAISPPLLLGPAAWIASVWQHSRYLFHVQDLQPDAAVGLGMLKPSALTRLLYALEAFSYRHAWRVSGISDGMLAAFAKKGVPPEKLVYFPNGIRLTAPATRGVFRRRLGFTLHDFLAIYSGNLGVKQGLEVLVEAARRLRNSAIHVIICGDGAQRAAIEQQAQGLPNLRVLPLLPEEEYLEMLADADVAVITQLAGSGQAFFPSKLLNSLAAGRPVLSVSDEDSELARAILESGCGCNVPPNRPDELAANLERLAKHPEELASCGLAGREWVKRFESDTVHTAFTAMLTVQPT